MCLYGDSPGATGEIKENSGHGLDVHFAEHPPWEYPQGRTPAKNVNSFNYIEEIPNETLRSQAIGVKARLIIRPDNENIICAALVWSSDKSR